MNELNKIIPNGTIVLTKNGDLKAIVTGICIRGLNNESIEYQIAYTLNGERKKPWVYSFEIKVKVDNSKPVGFTANNQKNILNL